MPQTAAQMGRCRRRRCSRVVSICRSTSRSLSRDATLDDLTWLRGEGASERACPRRLSRTSRATARRCRSRKRKPGLWTRRRTARLDARFVIWSFAILGETRGMNDMICDCRTDHRTDGRTANHPQPAKAADETERDGRACCPPQAHHQSRAHETRGTVLRSAGYLRAAYSFVPGQQRGFKRRWLRGTYIPDSTTRLGRRHAIARRSKLAQRRLGSCVRSFVSCVRRDGSHGGQRSTGSSVSPVSTTITHAQKHKSAYIGTYPGQDQPAQTNRQDREISVHASDFVWMDQCRSCTSVSTKCLSVCCQTYTAASASQRGKNKNSTKPDECCMRQRRSKHALACSLARPRPTCTHLPPLLPGKRLIPYA
ncbi:hypothetical protein BC567DRAFT_231286 [Phyllosticta citribraziliensis]